MDESCPIQLQWNSWASEVLCTDNVTTLLERSSSFFEFRNSSQSLKASMKGDNGRGILWLYQSTFKNFKGKFLKVWSPLLDKLL